MFASPFVYYTPDTSYSRPSRRSCASFPFEQSYFDIDQLNALRTAEIHRKQRQQAELRRQYELRLAQIEEYHRQQELELRRREAYTRKVQEQRRLQAQKRAEEKQRRFQQQQAEAQRYNEFIVRTINSIFGAEESNAEPEQNVFDPTPAFEAIYSIFNDHASKQPATEKVQSETNNLPEKSETPKEESISEKSVETSEENAEKESEEITFDPTETLNTLLSIVNSVFNEPETSDAKTEETEETDKNEKDESESQQTVDTFSVSESQVATETIADEASVESEVATETIADEASVDSEKELSDANTAEAEAVETSITPESLVSEAENIAYDTAEEDEDTSEEEYVLVEEKDEPTEVSPVLPEPTLTDTLNSISKKIDHNVAVYERVSKHATEAYTDSESDSISSLSTASESSSSATTLILRSRIKVLQRAQLELENLYEDLDNIETPSDISDKRLKQVLTGKAVSYADKVDELRLNLVNQLEKSKAKSTASASDVVTSKPAKEQSDNSSDNSSVRRVLVEIVQDEALSD
ncbi:hypothetical protein D0Z00_000016 [Geotrichum galactomycetum]|uniref:Uncharacterized protein n=1 Tax=Geotrichum galactomycetum TaxID=27317 RepID=A0ACB6VB28_9ASCO|nr:hypothetical protein D0Z00_000016 [Geotrichum candidum]